MFTFISVRLEASLVQDSARMGCSVELSFTNLVIGVALFVCIKKGWEHYQKKKVAKMLAKWDKTPQNKVIFHSVPRGKTLPNISPFCLKLETYLRFAKIPYEFEPTDPMGPKGKSPWISYNGTHIADSHLVIQFLNKKFNVDLNGRLDPIQREICRIVRVALENHFLFGLASWRWVESPNGIDTLMKIPKLMKPMIFMVSRKIGKALVAQGLGRHSIPERTQMTGADLKSVSVILGNKKFMGGDEPCEEDCGIFGILSQVLWAAPGSTYQKMVEDELPNLKEYCDRMKNKFWPDWDACIDKGRD